MTFGPRTKTGRIQTPEAGIRFPPAWKTLVCGLILTVAPLAWASEVEFPDPAPSSRIDAAALLAGGAGLPTPCLTPKIEQVHRNHAEAGATPGVRRALELLSRPLVFAREQIVYTEVGTPLRFTTEPRSFDRIGGSEGGTGEIPDVVRASVDGLRRARNLVVHLGLGAPDPFEVLFVELGDALDGYVVTSGRDRGTTIVLDATPREGLEGARRSAIHQFVHAAGARAGSGLSPAWGEALAVWTTLALDGAPEEATLNLLARRVETLNGGLLDPDLRAGAGNALWFFSTCSTRTAWRRSGRRSRS